jgi:toxin ParE1/3/4
MKLVITEQALNSLEECLHFLDFTQTPPHTIRKIRDRILSRIISLKENPHQGQVEPNLEHLELSHRRIVEGNYKIIYRVHTNTIYITDIFDSRQDPSKMKG